MKIGFPNNPRKDILTEIAWIGENGFDFVDLFLEPDKASLEAIDPAAVRREIERFGLDTVGHLAWYLPIGSPLPQLREAAVAAAGAYLGAFREIGVGAVTVHANWPPGMFSDDEGVGWQTQSLRELVRRAEALRIRLLYEPIDTRRDSPENVECILNQVPGLLCHLDTGHSNLFGRKPADLIRQFARKLFHLHVHDNDGFYDQHLPPGTGKVDWKQVFAALRGIGYDRTITLEVFSRDRDYVLLAKSKIERLIREPAG